MKDYDENEHEQDTGPTQMKDDSLSDVAFCNTKEEIHRKAMELNIAPWNLGCSCEECNRAFEAVLVEDKKVTDDSVSKQEPDGLSKDQVDWLKERAADKRKEWSDHKSNFYATEIWNEAIEAAAMELVKDMNFIPASKLVSQMLGLDLKTAYQLLMICRA